MNKTYPAIITNVVDGDTIDVSIDLGFDVSVKIRVRLAGINTCEMKDKDPAKKQLAQEAKDFVSTFVWKPVTITIKGRDCYGRYICEVDNINQSLIDKGLAQPVKY